jgi:hypothetical protein
MSMIDHMLKTRRLALNFNLMVYYLCYWLVQNDKKFMYLVRKVTLSGVKSVHSVWNIGMCSCACCA